MAGLRLLSVNAHPHDFTHHSGTLGIHVADGDSVTVVAMTGGASTHNQKLAEELAKPADERDMELIDGIVREYAAQKADELRTACGFMGITDVRILPFEDKPFTLQKYPEAVDALRDIILEVRPDIMITQSPYLNGRQGLRLGTRDDHSETGFASMEAKKRGRRAPVRGHSAHASDRRHLLPRCLLRAGRMGLRRRPSRTTSRGGSRRRRPTSPRAHTPEWARKRMEVTLGNAGWFSGTAYAEGFVQEKPFLLPKITLPESVLREAEETEAVRHERLLGKEPVKA